jgi:hypothetical protein
MSQDITRYKPEPEDDGFSNSSTSGRSRGTILKWDDQKGWRDRDGMAPPSPLLVLAIDEFLRRWKDNQLTDVRDKPLPNSDELNDAIPKTEWETDLNGKPAKPYQHHVGVYLVNLATATPYKYEASTTGAHIAYDDLKERVVAMRMIRGSRVLPVVILGDRPMKTKKWGMSSRPEFQIVGWKSPGDDTKALPTKPAPQLSGPAETPSAPATTAAPADNPAQPNQAKPKPKPPVKLADETLDAMDDVKPVTTSEIFKDEVPW